MSLCRVDNNDGGDIYDDRPDCMQPSAGEYIADYKLGPGQWTAVNYNAARSNGDDDILQCLVSSLSIIWSVVSSRGKNW